MLKISVVLPTKNEENTIASVIHDFQQIITQLNYQLIEIIIVDDSTDKTRKIAEQAGAVVLRGGGQGLGFAMRLGLLRATQKKPDLIISADSDGQVDPHELIYFIKPILEENIDMTISSRFLDSTKVNYNYPPINRLGTKILTAIINQATDFNVTDSHGGIRVMRSYVAQELTLLGSHTYVQETLIDAFQKGFKIKEISSVWQQRRFGKSKVVASIPWYILNTLPILLLRMHWHIKIFYPFAFGLLLYAILIYTTQHSITNSILLLSSSLIIIIGTTILEQIIQIRLNQNVSR